jgi:hypothetical protein
VNDSHGFRLGDMPARRPPAPTLAPMPRFDTVKRNGPAERLRRKRHPMW